MEDGQPNSFAREVIQRLPTYTEVSTSGTGIHLLATGELPEGNRGRRAGSLEVYGTGRYFVVTGQSIGEHTGLANGTEAAAALIRDHIDTKKPKATTARQPVDVLALDDSKLIERIKRSTQGATFFALWSGDTSAYNGDQSAADMALCNILAFWTGKDAARMDNLFRQSALMRLKWDERHGRDTYGAITIERAINDCMQVYTGKRPRKELATEDSPFYRYESAYNAIHGFQCEDGNLYAEKITQGGEVVLSKLSNFLPLITQEVTRDDGGEVK